MAASFLLSVCLAGSSRGSGSPTNEVDARRIYDATLQSASRRFMVIGLDRAQNYEAAVWAETMAGRVEHAVGLLLPEKRWRTFRLNLTDRLREGGEPWAEESIGHDGHRWVLRLLLRDAAHAPPGPVGDALVRILLSAYIVDARVGLPDGDIDSPCLAPAWMAAGLLDSVDPLGREQCAATAFAAWERGQLPLPADYLKAEGNIPANPVAARAMGALLVRWIEMQPDRKESFRQVFEALAANGAMDGAMFSKALGLESAAELSAAWDEWMLHQRRIVHRPGVATALAVEMLKAQLLLYPSDFATALGGGLDAPSNVAQLVEYRKAPWLSDVANVRCAAIRMAAVGRGDECDKVASLYCAFLEGLIAGKSDRKLRQMIERASAALTELEKSAGTAGGNGACLEREP